MSKYRITLAEKYPTTTVIKVKNKNIKEREEFEKRMKQASKNITKVAAGKVGRSKKKY